MNLLHNIIPPQNLEIVEEDTIFISQFRKNQYENINFILKNCIDFLEVISHGYIKFKNIQVTSNIKYFGLYGYYIKKIIVNIEDPEDREKDKQFFCFNIPELLHESFFYLNGSYYSPAIYILDKPIIYKENSIKLYGLINSITLFLKSGQDRAIFCGRNIPIQYFLQWFIDDDEVLTKLEDSFKMTGTRFPEETLTRYFSEFFGCKKENIDKVFNLLFFDNYTREIYKNCYGQDFDVKSLVNFAVENYINENKIHFVDLLEKRIIFIELLLSPIFKRISNIALNMLRGHHISAISIPENEIIKFFMVENGLRCQFFYDLVNLYSGILTHKATFMNPNSSTAPREISSIHPSHFGRICSITTSAKDPGESISIIPTTKVNKYGLFI